MQQTSIDTFKEIQHKLPSMRTLVLNAVTAAGENGVTAEDIYKQYPQIPTSSINARFSELQVRGKIQHHGYRRNSRGRKMLVWTTLSA